MQTPDKEYREIQLTQGKVAKVSPHRFEELNKLRWHARWCPHKKSFYAEINLPSADGKWVGLRTSMHRMILGLPIGDKRIGDHVNGDTLDNQDTNLRICTPAQNTRNRRVDCDSKSGFKGVCCHASHGRDMWEAKIICDGKYVYLGRFPFTEEGKIQAARAYDAAALKHHGEFAYLNFPHEHGRTR